MTASAGNGCVLAGELARRGLRRAAAPGRRLVAEACQSVVGGVGEGCGELPGDGDGVGWQRSGLWLPPGASGGPCSAGSHSSVCYGVAGPVAGLKQAAT